MTNEVNVNSKYAIHELDVFGYHLINILIHVMNGLFVWWLMQILLSISSNKTQPLSISRNLIALAAALIFVAHPIQTEAVTYTAQRITSLATFFYLFSLCCYLRGRLNKSHSFGWFIAAGVWAVLGMLTKQIVFTLPFLIILIECLFLAKEEGGIGDILKNQGWWILGVLSFAWIIPLLMRFQMLELITREVQSRSHIGDTLNGWSYFLTQFRAIFTYIRLMFIPLGQNLDYDFPVSRGIFDISTMLGAIILLAIGFMAIRLCRDKVMMGFGILWFFITISVTSSIVVIPHVIFEHRVYLPMVGFY